MTRYAITFGSQYDRVTHPVCDAITRDSFVVLVAEDYNAAHHMAMMLTAGGYFSFLYDYDSADFRGQIVGYELEDKTPEYFSALWDKGLIAPQNLEPSDD